MPTPLYFRTEDCLFAYPLEKHLEDAKEAGETSITLFEAIPDRLPDDVFFCQKFDEIGDTGLCNSRDCSAYSPRNGKSGCCRFYSKKGYVKGKIKTFEVK